MLARGSGRQWLWIACAALALLWYPALISLLGFPPGVQLDFGLAFNSMAEYLLAGRFDVDPDAIGAEGFDLEGRTVSYFGIFCALLRLPLVLLGFARTDITWWSCLVAMWLSTLLQMRAIDLVWQRSSPSRQTWLACGLLISVVLGGPHIQFLRPSIYQEPINWAFCQAMGFIFLAIRGWTARRGFDRSTLCLMALCAGLALLTRVSFGIGLYASFGLFLLARGQPRTWPAPGSILLAFVIMVGIVNAGRWGNPLTFADFSYFNLSQDVYPDRLRRLADHGNFNLGRVWLGLSYYFLPIWIWIREDGRVLFAEAQSRLMDSMELPPGSFLLTDPFQIGLAVAGLMAFRDRERAALSIGLCVQPLLMLCATSMAHRYRMEFYPLLFVVALFAMMAPVRREATTRRFRIAVVASVVFGVIASHGMAVLAARAPWGPGEFYLERYGLVGTFARTSW
jgi:hypothetical protein